VVRAQRCDEERTREMMYQSRGILGVKTADGRVVPVLDFKAQKGHRTVFTTIADMQEKAVFDFFYRDQQSPQWQYLDSLALEWIPPARAGDPDLLMNVQTDEQGNLSVHLYDPARQETSAFVLAADTLSHRCRESGNAATPDKEGIPAGHVQTQVRKKRNGWILLFLLVPALILVIVFFRLNPPPLPWQRTERPVKQGTERVGAVEAGHFVPAVEEPQEEGARPGIKTIEQAGSTTKEESGLPSPNQKSLQTETKRYQIVWGDTLWRVSERFYGERRLFEDLAEINRLRDPDYIIAGETLYLPPELRGRKRIP
jgi:nucleoid-associated protein YgaU